MASKFFFCKVMQIIVLFSFSNKINSCNDEFFGPYSENTQATSTNSRTSVSAEKANSEELTMKEVDDEDDNQRLSSSTYLDVSSIKVSVSCPELGAQKKEGSSGLSRSRSYSECFLSACYNLFSLVAGSSKK
jgi:hypothetical protein